ncbi:MAG: thiamine diphosphokinase [Ignavibacteria bacterium]|nr:thiamine diphosphokinase [Ignavibacteria bacterium]
MKTKAVIFLNGVFPHTKVISANINTADYLIAADGAANLLKDIQITPDVIIGDLDSIEKNVLKYFLAKDVPVIKYTEQETTDFEKSLNFVLQTAIKDVIIFGFTSLRPDHSLNNFSVLKRYYKKLNIKFIDDTFIIEFIKKKVSFKYRKNRLISLLPFPGARGITTKGLRYSLNDESLSLGVREGTLNVATSENVTVSFKTGDLILFRKHFIGLR